MQLVDKIKKYKDIIIKEAFKDIDPKDVTNEMLESKIEKGGMFCPSLNKTLCFNCGCFSRIKANESCHSCDVVISI